jgi:hypothetical protein
MKGYRTLLVNLIPLVALIVDYLVGNSAFVSHIVRNPETAIVVIGTLNVLNIILRFVTNTSVFKKE